MINFFFQLCLIFYFGFFRGFWNSSPYISSNIWVRTMSGRLVLTWRNAGVVFLICLSNIMFTHSFIKTLHWLLRNFKLLFNNLWKSWKCVDVNMYQSLSLWQNEERHLTKTAYFRRKINCLTKCFETIIRK